MAITTSLKVAAEAAADALGRLINTVVDTKVDAKTFTISRLIDLSPDDEKLEDWYLYNPNASPAEWHRVDGFSITSGNLTAIQAFTDPPEASEAVQLYSILSPDEWRAAVNAFLQTVFFEDVIQITLTSGKNLYGPSDHGATWLQSKGQILGYKYENTGAGAANVARESVPVVEPIEDDNAVSFYFPALPGSVSDLKVHVRARRYYGALATEADTTTCPYPLLIEGTKFEALKMIFSRMGARAKPMFGQEMVLTERELAKAKGKWLPPITHEEQRTDEDWAGVDLGYLPDTWSW